MFELNFNPNILKIGFLEIRWYALIYAIGFVLFYLYLKYFVKGRMIDELDDEKSELFVIYSIIGILFGARIFYFLFYNLSGLISDPFELFRIWNSGLSFHGALIGVVVSLVIFSKRYDIDVWKLFDVSAVITIFALMLGRVGNLINGEIAGTPFDGPWCAVFPLYDNVCRHPYPVYAFISHLLLFMYLFLVLYIKRNDLKRFIGTRVMAANFMIGYGALRIITDIWKVDGIFLFMKTGQWLSLFMVLAGVLLLVFRKK